MLFLYQRKALRKNRSAPPHKPKAPSYRIARIGSRLMLGMDQKSAHLDTWRTPYRTNYGFGERSDCVKAQYLASAAQ